MSALPQPRSTRDGRRGGQRDLRLVRPEPQRHTLAFALLLLVVAAGVVFGAVALNALAAGDAVAAHRLGERVAAEQVRYERLVAEVAYLEQPGRIRQVATGELGMVEPITVRTLHVARPLPADRQADPVAGATAPDPLKALLTRGRP